MKPVFSFTTATTNENYNKKSVEVTDKQNTDDDNYKVNFRFLEEKTGDIIEVKAKPGRSVLNVAWDNDVDIEGACGGQMACSTCHVVLDKTLYDTLPHKVEEEDDMLDLAFGLTDTSRLGCQIKVSKDFEGQTLKVPRDTNNLL